MNNQLHFKRYLVVLIAVLVTVLFATVPVSAASKATKNKKAVALYEQKAGKLKQLYSKKYIDITGDGIKEGIFLYKPIGAGGYIFNFQILTYQNIQEMTFIQNNQLVCLYVMHHTTTLISILSNVLLQHVMQILKQKIKMEILLFSWHLKEETLKLWNILQ